MYICKTRENLYNNKIGKIICILIIKYVYKYIDLKYIFIFLNKMCKFVINNIANFIFLDLFMRPE